MGSGLSLGRYSNTSEGLPSVELNYFARTSLNCVKCFGVGPTKYGFFSLLICINSLLLCGAARMLIVFFGRWVLNNQKLIPGQDMAFILKAMKIIKLLFTIKSMFNNCILTISSSIKSHKKIYI